MLVAGQASHHEIKEVCLRLLTRREHSQKELLDKLDIRGFNRSESALVVNAMSEQGWQSDQRFAESYVRYRIKKGYGPIKIVFELQQRGIESVDLEAVLLDLTGGGWDEIVDSVYEKKYSDDKLLSHNAWLKRSRFLQQRGFSGEMIKALFKRLGIQLNYS